MKMIKRSLAILCLAALLLSLGACGGSGGSIIGLGHTEPFRIAVCQMPDSLNPLYAESDLAREFFLLAYDPLWRMDENYEPVPCLVDSWDVSSDGLVWTIRLRQDVYFSDPTAEEPQQLTASDVKFSYELFMRFADDYDSYFEGISSIACPDRFTVVITTSQVKGDMLYNPTPILPKYIWSDYASAPSSMDNAAMIGSGPFTYQPVTLAEGEVQTVWTFAANDDYFGGEASLEQLIFQYESTPVNAALLLVDGVVDACLDLTDIQLMTLEGQENVTLLAAQGPGRGSYVMAMNMLSGALTDDRVRQAVLSCLNKDRIYEIALGGVGVKGYGFADPGSDSFLDPAADTHSYDPDYALSLLTAAGYSDYDGDGVLETKDNTLELSFTLYTSTCDPWAAAAQTILAADLAELGVEINWKTTDSRNVESVCRKNGNWDIYIASQPSGIDPQYTASSLAGGSSHTGWQSEEYDQVYAQFVSASDETERASLCRRLQEIVLADCPRVVLGYGLDVQAIRSDRWTGYEDCAEAAGGLFGTGSAAAYMNIRPLSNKELEERAQAASAGNTVLSEAPETAGEAAEQSH